MAAGAVHPARVHAPDALLAGSTTEGDGNGNAAAEVGSHRNGFMDGFEAHGERAERYCTYVQRASPLCRSNRLGVWKPGNARARRASITSKLTIVERCLTLL